MPESLELFTKELFGYIECYGMTAVVIGICAGGMYVLAGLVRASAHGVKRSWRSSLGRGLLTACFFLYLAMLFAITIFSRETGSITVVNLKPFNTFRYKRFTVENVMLFMPFGFFYYFLTHGKLRHFYMAGIAGMLMSAGIEIVQYVTQRGGAELDDILTNTIGAVLGYLPAALMHFAWAEETKEKS